MAEAQVGYGQQNPNTSADDFNKIAFLVSQMVAQMATTKLVKVTKVTGGGPGAPAGTVSVQPLVNQIDGAGNSVEHGIVNGIPWTRVQGAYGAIVADPGVGDVGWVACCDRDISAVKQNKGVSNPGSFRTFDVADGVYVGGVLNDAPAQYLAFTDDGVTIKDKTGNTIVMDATGITLTDATGNVLKMTSAGIEAHPSGALPFKVNGIELITGNLMLQGSLQSQTGTTYAGNLHTTGTVTGDTDVVGAGKSLATHTHNYLRPSTGATTSTATGAPN